MSGSVELTMVVKRTFVHAQLTPTDASVSRRSRTTSDLGALSLEDPGAKYCLCSDAKQSGWECATSFGDDSDLQLLESDSEDLSEVDLSSPDQSPRAAVSSCATVSATAPGSFSSLPLSPPAFRFLFPLAVVPVAFRLPLPASQAAASRQSQSLSHQQRSDSPIGGTTLILKNLPSTLSREVFLGVFDDAGFRGRYDFAYLPTNMSNGGSYCYAFINMISHEAALDFFERLDGFCAWPRDAGRAMHVLWSEIQGQQTYIDKYRNSSVMHESVPDYCKPALFRDGSRVPFPAPTQRIKAPRLRDRKLLFTKL